MLLHRASTASQLKTLGGTVPRAFCGRSQRAVGRACRTLRQISLSQRRTQLQPSGEDQEGRAPVSQRKAARQERHRIEQFKVDLSSSHALIDLPAWRKQRQSSRLVNEGSADLYLFEAAVVDYVLISGQTSSPADLRSALVAFIEPAPNLVLSGRDMCLAATKAAAPPSSQAALHEHLLLAHIAACFYMMEGDRGTASTDAQRWGSARQLWRLLCRDPPDTCFADPDFMALLQPFVQAWQLMGDIGTMSSVRPAISVPAALAAVRTYLSTSGEDARRPRCLMLVDLLVHAARTAVVAGSATPADLLPFLYLPLRCVVEDRFINILVGCGVGADARRLTRLGATLEGIRAVRGALRGLPAPASLTALEAHRRVLMASNFILVPLASSPSPVLEGPLILAVAAFQRLRQLDPQGAAGVLPLLAWACWRDNRSNLAQEALFLCLEPPLPPWSDSAVAAVFHFTLHALLPPVADAPLDAAAASAFSALKDLFLPSSSKARGQLVAPSSLSGATALLQRLARLQVQGADVAPALDALGVAAAGAQQLHWLLPTVAALEARGRGGSSGTLLGRDTCASLLHLVTPALQADATSPLIPERVARQQQAWTALLAGFSDVDDPLQPSLEKLLAQQPGVGQGQAIEVAAMRVYLGSCPTHACAALLDAACAALQTPVCIEEDGDTSDKQQQIQTLLALMHLCRARDCPVPTDLLVRILDACALHNTAADGVVLTSSTSPNKSGAQRATFAFGRSSMPADGKGDARMELQAAQALLLDLILDADSTQGGIALQQLCPRTITFWAQLCAAAGRRSLAAQVLEAAEQAPAEAMRHVLLAITAADGATDVADATVAAALLCPSAVQLAIRQKDAPLLKLALQAATQHNVLSRVDCALAIGGGRDTASGLVAAQALLLCLSECSALLAGAMLDWVVLAVETQLAALPIVQAGGQALLPSVAAALNLLLPSVGGTVCGGDTALALVRRLSSGAALPAEQLVSILEPQAVEGLARAYQQRGQLQSAAITTATMTDRGAQRGALLQLLAAVALVSPEGTAQGLDAQQAAAIAFKPAVLAAVGDCNARLAVEATAAAELHGALQEPVKGLTRATLTAAATLLARGNHSGTVLSWLQWLPPSAQQAAAVAAACALQALPRSSITMDGARILEAAHSASGDDLLLMDAVAVYLQQGATQQAALLLGQLSGGLPLLPARVARDSQVAAFRYFFTRMDGIMRVADLKEATLAVWAMLGTLLMHHQECGNQRWAAGLPDGALRLCLELSCAEGWHEAACQLWRQQKNVDPTLLGEELAAAMLVAAAMTTDTYCGPSILKQQLPKYLRSGSLRRGPPDVHTAHAAVLAGSGYLERAWVELQAVVATSSPGGAGSASQQRVRLAAQALLEGWAEVEGEAQEAAVQLAWQLYSSMADSALVRSSQSSATSQPSAVSPAAAAPSLQVRPLSNVDRSSADKGSTRSSPSSSAAVAAAAYLPLHQVAMPPARLSTVAVMVLACGHNTELRNRCGARLLLDMPRVVEAEAAAAAAAEDSALLVGPSWQLQQVAESLLGLFCRHDMPAAAAAAVFVLPACGVDAVVLPASLAWELSNSGALSAAGHALAQSDARVASPSATSAAPGDTAAAWQQVSLRPKSREVLQRGLAAVQRARQTWVATGMTAGPGNVSGMPGRGPPRSLGLEALLGLELTAEFN